MVNRDPGHSHGAMVTVMVATLQVTLLIMSRSVGTLGWERDTHVVA